jgi:hypothetical protein
MGEREDGDYLFYFLFCMIFNWTDMWGPQQYNLFCHISADMWVSHVRFGVNSRLTRDQCELQKITQKIVVFCD